MAGSHGGFVVNVFEERPNCLPEPLHRSAFRQATDEDGFWFPAASVALVIFCSEERRPSGVRGRRTASPTASLVMDGAEHLPFQVLPGQAHVFGETSIQVLC